MRELCAAEWNCVRSVRWVNNLRITKIRRWRIDENVVVTPYDARFPRLAVWVVQVAQDILDMLEIQLALTVVFGIAISAALKKCIKNPSIGE